MVKHIFVINLDEAEDRWDEYKDDDRYTRWKATHYEKLDDDDPIFKKMISYHNIDKKEHRAKCACFLSHTSLWKHIIKEDLKDVLILEDDALLVNSIPNDLPTDGFTYLGGFTSNKRMTDGPKKVDFKKGIHLIDHGEYRLLMCLAIYIPNAYVAHKMLQSTETFTKRIKAVDTMIRMTHLNQYVSFPASFIEKPIDSQIRDKKKKFSNERYEWVSAKNLIKEYDLEI